MVFVLLVLVIIALIIVIADPRLAPAAIGLVLVAAIAMMGRTTMADTDATTVEAYHSCLIYEARSKSPDDPLAQDTFEITSGCNGLRKAVVQACEQAGHGDQECLDDIAGFAEVVKAAAVE